MQTVWKYTIPVQDDPYTVVTKHDSRFLDAQPSTSGRVDEIDVWLLVDPAQRNENRTFVVRGTGQPVPPVANRYRGTIARGVYPLALVWHLFEVE